jgi:nucleoside-diphosphate-sugar epimerase
MNILLTGVLGHIGSSLFKKILAIKELDTLYIIDNARSNNINTLFNIKSKKKIIFFCDDLNNKKILKKIDKKIDIIIHLASITNAEESFKKKDLIYKNNFGIFKKIVSFCLKNKSKFIHLSSTSVYGAETLEVDETCNLLKPQSPYADIKLLEEKYLKNKLNKNNYITLRLGTIVGVSKGMRFHTAVNKFCFKTILGEPIPVWNNAIDQYRPYLSLQDAINVILFIIKKKLFNGEIYNIVTKNYTVRQVIKIIKSKRFFLKIIKTNSPILNQNSYKVSRKKFDFYNFKFKNGIEEDIFQTLKILKYLYRY